MRNLKRVLSLVLAAMMLIGMMVIGASAASTTEGGYGSDLGDYDAVNQDYQEAVAVIEGLDVIQGYEDGDYHPTDILQRDQAAKIIACLLLGEKKAEDLNPNTTHFADVPAGYWAAGYIDYCVSKGILAGYGDGNFGPHDKLTGYQFGKMLLVALGYDAEIEGYANDDNYITNISVDMIENDIYVPGVLIVDPVSREVAAQMAFNTLDAQTVDYTIQHFVQVAEVNDDTLGMEVFGLDHHTDTTGVWGRPVEVWTGDTAKAAPARTVATYTYPLTASFTTEVTECDVYDAVEDAVGVSGKTIDVCNFVLDGVTTPAAEATEDGSAEIVDTEVRHTVGAQGRLTEVYVADFNEDGKDEAWIVGINTYLAQISDTKDAGEDVNGHPYPAETTFQIYNTLGKDDTLELTEDFAAAPKGNYVLVNVYTDRSGRHVDPETIQYPEVVNGIDIATVTAPAELTDKSARAVSNGKVTPAATTVGEKYDNAYEFNLGKGIVDALDPDDLDDTDETYYNAFLDQYGNIIGLKEVDYGMGWMVIQRIEWKHNAGDFDGYAMADAIVYDNGKRGDPTYVNGLLISEVITETEKGGENEVTNAGDSYGDPEKGTVSDNWRNNGGYSTEDIMGYYNHIWWYKTDLEGNYTISDHAEWDVAGDTGHNTDNHESIPYDNKTDVTFYDLTEATLTQGGHRISGKTENGTASDWTNKIVVNADTVFVVKTSADEYSYTVTKGKTGVDTIRKATVCAMVDTDTGYAKVIVVTAATTQSPLLIAYVPVAPGASANTSTEKVRVYPMTGTGRQSKTITVDLNTTQITKTGLYVFEDTDADGVYKITMAGATDYADLSAVTDGIILTSLTTETGKWEQFDGKSTTPNTDTLAIDDVYFDRGAVTTDLKGASLEANAYDGVPVATDVDPDKDTDGKYAATAGTPLNDYNMENATIIKVTKHSDGTGKVLDTTAETLSKGTVDDLTKGKVVLVAYTQERGYNEAAYVYVYEVIFDKDNTGGRVPIAQENIVKIEWNENADLDGDGSEDNNGGGLVVTFNDTTTGNDIFTNLSTAQNVSAVYIRTMGASNWDLINGAIDAKIMKSATTNVCQIVIPYASRGSSSNPTEGQIMFTVNSKDYVLTWNNQLIF